MFENPQTYLVFAVLSALVYWAIPGSLPRARAISLIAFSAVAIFLASPLALALCASVTLVVFLTVLAMDRFARTPVMWLGIALIVANLVLMEVVVAELTVFATIGLSYITLKSISVIIDHWDARDQAARPGLLEVFLLNAFFPIFSAGPIERLPTFALDALTARIDHRKLIEGMARITLGLFKTAFVYTTLIVPYLNSRYGQIFDYPDGFDRGDFLAYSLLNFLALYVNFSGYTDIAVGTGRLYALDVMENFRFPFLAKNIQDFWQRWHLSLGNFVNRYVFMTFARLTRGQIELSLVLSFVLVGLWHDLTLPYLFWGFMHGSALALVVRMNRLSRRYPIIGTVRRNPVYGVLARIVTLIFASYVYTFASTGSLAHGQVLTLRLFGP